MIDAVVLERNEEKKEPTVPTLKVGEIVPIKGWPFQIVRFNTSMIVLRPIPHRPDVSARRLLERMKGT